MSAAYNPIKRLAGETAVYGMGTIVPRLLNYLLTPFFTRILVKADYSVLTELYSWIAILLVVLTYGMETAFFRFSSQSENKKKVYSTAFTSILITTLLFLVFIFIFNSDIASALGYVKTPEYILFVSLIVAMDALAAIPFAHLREKRKALRFSTIKLINVVVNVLLNLFFLWLAPKIVESNPQYDWLLFYKSGIDVGYIFIANLISSAVTLLLLSPELFKIRIKIDPELWKRMLRFAYPLAIVILAGMINEVADKLLMKYLLSNESLEVRKSMLGEYGANFKLAVLMSIFIQMFRFAAEPFFFAQAKEKNAKDIYAEVMKYFIIFGWLIFLGVMLFLDILKYFIDESYHAGLFIVPVILIAKLFQGVFYNLSIWYKLTDMTKIGAYIALAGTVVTLASNFILVPKIGYAGAALGQLLCYSSMVILSFFIGRKHFKVKYPLKKIAAYSGLALLLYGLSSIITIEHQLLSLAINGLLLLSFITVAWFGEKNNLQQFSQKGQ